MSTTPTYQRSSSLPRRPSSAQRSRPTTPLRPPSRSGSFRGSVSLPPGSGALPLEALEAQFAEVSDGMADLEANFFNLGLMHESLARFSEDFASFLYGMNMNAFCVDFPEAPISDSFKRFAARPPSPTYARSHHDADTDATFMTTDTSFIEHPPTVKPPPKFETPAPSRVKRGGGIPTRGGAARGARGGMRGSGIARARGSGIGRGGRA